MNGLGWHRRGPPDIRPLAGWFCRCSVILWLLGTAVLLGSDAEAQLLMPELLVPELTMRAELRITGTSARAVDFTLPPVEGWRWRWSPDRWQRDDSGGQVTTSYEIRFMVEDIGALSLPAGQVRLEDGRLLHTAPITATIPAPRPDLDQAVHIDGRAQPAQALTGEAIHLRWTVLRLITARDTQFRLPRSLGLTGDPHIVSRPSQHHRGAIRGADNRIYQVTSIDQVISYTRPGSQQSRGTLAFGYHDNHGEFIGRHQVSIDPVTIDISAPPSHNRPPGFSGRIHPVTLETHVEESPGGSTRLVVLASGRDPQLIPRPLIQHDNSLELSPRSIDQSIDPHGRRFAWDILATRPGRARIGPISLPYYDPKGQRYHQATVPFLFVDLSPDAIASDALSARPALLPPTALNDPAIDAAVAQQRPGDVMAVLAQRMADHDDWRLWHDAAVAAAADGARAQALAWLLQARQLAPHHPQVVTALRTLQAPEVLVQTPSLLPDCLAGGIGLLLMGLVTGIGLIAGWRRQVLMASCCAVMLMLLIAAALHVRASWAMTDLAVLIAPTTAYDSTGRVIAELPAGTVVQLHGHPGQDGRMSVETDDGRRVRIDVGDLHPTPQLPLWP